MYRARDTKLKRDVAIKVLPAAFVDDAQRMARFEREAQLLASLNHPNISAIFGLEESEKLRFLVLELVPGETLAELLQKGPLSVPEALELAGQIADALAAAHDRGVIHRDLKPANIKITPDGRVKVLDFGLAKALADEPEDQNLSDSPTLSAHATKIGVILGTAAYMSPEQARGRAVDKRTDIFSFGSVLYEMLTGRQLFRGEDAADTMASVIRSDPDLKNLPPDGRFVAYHSNVSGGTWQIFVQALDGSQPRKQVSVHGGRSPVWSPDGREIFYMDFAASSLMSVPVQTEPELEIGVPKALFPWPEARSLNRNWDVAPDGEHFVMTRRLRDEAPRVNVVVNWFEGLNPLVPIR